MKHSKWIVGTGLVALTLVSASTSFAEKGGHGRALGKEHKAQTGLALGKHHDKDDSMALGQHHTKQSGLSLGEITRGVHRDRDDLRNDRDRDGRDDRDATRTMTRTGHHRNSGRHLGWTKGKRHGHTKKHHSSNASHGRGHSGR